MHGIFFYQASTVVKLVRAIVKVWGTLQDVTLTHNDSRTICMFEPGKKMTMKTMKKDKLECGFALNNNKVQTQNT